MARYAMIMAGGSGTRLWPLSRRAAPKQLVPLINGESLLSIAAQRLDGVVDGAHRLICTGERYRNALAEALPEFTPAQILGEPEGRDTLNAVGLTAAVLAKNDPEAIFAVLTADHLIEPKEVFADRLAVGFGLVEEDPTRLVTFSITPTYPSTGYGYVQRGEAIPGHETCFRAQRFVEKPDLATAEGFLAAGNYGWNSGMFVFQAQVVLDAIGRHEPETKQGLDAIAAAWGTADQEAVLGSVYPTLRKVSIDYGLMEPGSDDSEVSICVVPMALSWVDVGSWPSFGETIEPDQEGNRVTTSTTWRDLSSTGLLVFSDDPSHTISTIGCHDLVIVHTPDATLICATDDAERVKEMAENVPESHK